MKKFIISNFVAIGSLALVGSARADSVLNTLNQAATGNQGSGGAYNAGVNEFTLSSIVGTAVSVALGLLGVIFIVLTLFAGFNYMTSQGDEQKTKTALDTLKTSIIGLVIVTTAYAIWRFVISNIFKGGSI